MSEGSIMTEEQVRAIVREEISAAEERMRAEISMVESDARVANVRASIAENRLSAVEAKLSRTPSAR